jgi:hypothetical protein
VQWELEFGSLPEPVDEIIVRCRTHVIAAARRLVVIEENVRIARAAHARGQRLAIGSNASTNTVAAGLAATGLDTLFRTVVTWSDVPAGRGKPAPDIHLLAARQLDVLPEVLGLRGRRRRRSCGPGRRHAGRQRTEPPSAPLTSWVSRDALTVPPCVDVVGQPHPALLELGHGVREVRSAGDLVRALTADAVEAEDSDLMGSVESDRSSHCAIVS